MRRASVWSITLVAAVACDRGTRDEAAHASAAADAPIDFGRIADSSPRQAHRVVTNRTGHAWRGCTLAKSCGCIGASSPDLPGDVQPGASVQIDVVFVPTGQKGSVDRLVLVKSADGVVESSIPVRAQVEVQFETFADVCRLVADGDGAVFAGASTLYFLAKQQPKSASTRATGAAVAIGDAFELDRLHAGLPIRVTIRAGRDAESAFAAGGIVVDLEGCPMATSVWLPLAPRKGAESPLAFRSRLVSAEPSTLRIQSDASAARNQGAVVVRDDQGNEIGRGSSDAVGAFELVLGAGSGWIAIERSIGGSVEVVGTALRIDQGEESVLKSDALSARRPPGE